MLSLFIYRFLFPFRFRFLFLFLFPFLFGIAVSRFSRRPAENRERDWEETLKTLSPRFTDFLTDFEKKKLAFILSSVYGLFFINAC